MLDDTAIAIKPGERVLVAGELGTGKSTLVRAIAGLWPWGGGEINIKKGAKLMMLPQRPYIPIGTLRRAATYPDSADSRDIKQIAEAFKRVGLDHLVDRIEEEAPWDQTLSGGEKQRLAFARIFLHNPDIIVLDEATAALDPQSQDKLMELLSKELKDVTIISVAHRPELDNRVGTDTGIIARILAEGPFLLDIFRAGVQHTFDDASSARAGTSEVYGLRRARSLTLRHNNPPATSNSPPMPGGLVVPASSRQG